MKDLLISNQVRASIKKYLEAECVILDDIHAKGGGSKKHFKRFILDNGIEFTKVISNYNYKGRPNRCFTNSYDLSLIRNLRYVEGLATCPELNGFLVHHAWCIDENDQVIDCTWENYKNCEYYGIVFNRTYMCSVIVRTRIPGFLDRFDVTPHISSIRPREFIHPDYYDKRGLTL